MTTTCPFNILSLKTIKFNIMQNKILIYIYVFLFSILNLSAQESIYYGSDANNRIKGAKLLRYNKDYELPNHVEFAENNYITFDNFDEWSKTYFKVNNNINFNITSRESDALGKDHYRCIQTYNNIPIFEATFILHIANNKIYSLNGTLYQNINITDGNIIEETQALDYALRSTKAKKFKWQSVEEETALKEQSENPNATYFPEGELFYLNNNNNNNFHQLAWRFNVYASDTLLHEWIFVDAYSGKILMKLPIIHNTDTPGTAVTKYSGTQTITSDSYSGTYRLRESGRGNGIRTYNMQQGTNYANAVDFTDNDNYWDNFNSNFDEVATDAHWAAEKYYDYLYNEHNRNSLDNSGLALLSYIHYDYLYANAFWDGLRMTYGDGDGSSWSPLTPIDIAGHEMTHGLTSYTADLVYQDESGAMNEAFSDIFGTALEFYAKPADANWLIGENIGSALRSMANPKSYGLPDTYLGQYWYSGTGDNGGVHTNCGVMSHWFYLIVQGGSGTNDNNNTYNITGIGMQKAEQIAFRLLTVYLTNTAQHYDARYYSIIATADLYGSCSPEVEAVTNAWYAVGVGNPYSANVTADFSCDETIFCQTPAVAKFNNLTVNASSYKWYFGDGNTSTQQNPSHTYNTYGNFEVSLVGYGGACGNDSIAKTAFISVDTQNPCSFIMPSSGTSNINDCNGILYDNGGTGVYPNNSTSITTIAPPGASALTLDFKMFDVESGSGAICDYDYLEIYNGSSTSSPLIGRYCNTTGSPGIINTGGAATIKFYTDPALNLEGFKMYWTCTTPTLPPLANFTTVDTFTCTGSIQFFDISLNGPQQWKWNFGDGNFSFQQNPLHTYNNNGIYNVKLTVTNAYGSDSVTFNNYINVNLLQTPVVVPDLVCDSGTLSLSASTSEGIISWYDDITGNTTIATGSTFTTPYLTSSATYYVQASDTVNNIYYGGKTDNSGGGGNYNLNYIHYQSFTCYEPVILKSVKVYSSSNSSRTIYLRDAYGNNIETVTKSIPNGESRVELNMNVPVGTGLQLAAQTYPNLYRNNGGTAYPYSIGDAITITGSSASGTPLDYYYYFYDWEIIETDTCFSPRIPVDATVVSINPTISQNGTVYLCTGDSIALDAIHNSVASQYLWQPNNDTLQSIYASTAGTYFYNIIDENGCSATSPSVEIIVSDTLPVADFNYYFVGDSVVFVNNSTNAYNYIWNFGDGNSSTVINPIHVYNKDSIYIVSLIANSSCNSDSTTDTVYYINTDISKLSSDYLINIFPNPAKDFINLNINSPFSEVINVSLFNMLGEEIYSEKIMANRGFNNYTINIQEISASVFFVNIRTKNTTYIRKILSY